MANFLRNRFKKLLDKTTIDERLSDAYRAWRDKPSNRIGTKVYNTGKNAAKAVSRNMAVPFTPRYKQVHQRQTQAIQSNPYVEKLGRSIYRFFDKRPTLAQGTEGVLNAPRQIQKFVTGNAPRNLITDKAPQTTGQKVARYGGEIAGAMPYYILGGEMAAGIPAVGRLAQAASKLPKGGKLASQVVKYGIGDLALDPILTDDENKVKAAAEGQVFNLAMMAVLGRLKPIAKIVKKSGVADDALEGLMKQAKKYKSAEEFVRVVFADVNGKNTVVGDAVIKPTGKLRKHFDAFMDIKADGVRGDVALRRFHRKVVAGKNPFVSGIVDTDIYNKAHAVKVKPEAPKPVKVKEVGKTKGTITEELTPFRQVEELVYGSETPTRMSFEQGTKRGAGKLTNATRYVQESLSKTVGAMTEHPNVIVRNIGRGLQGFSGGLGKTQPDVVRKAEFGGGIDYAQKVSGDLQQYVYKTVDNNKKSLERIHAVLDPDLATKAVKEASLTPAEKEALSTIRVVSDYINDTNYKNGFISEDLWRKNRGGKYIARAYEPIEYPPEVADFLKQRKNKFDLNPFIKRELLDDWKQANAIRDPAYLTSKRLQQTMFNNEVKKTSESMLNSKYVSDIAKPGYVQLSDSKQYGELAGKYVRKDILEDMQGLFFTHKAAQQLYEVLGWYDRNPIRQSYKKIFTVFNPAVRLGNKTSNYVFAMFNGINPVTFTKNQHWAGRAIDANDGLYRRMIRDGLVGTDITKADTTKFARELSKNATPSQTRKIHDALVYGYGKTDDKAKLAAMKTWLDRGYAYDESARRVMAGYQNYRSVGYLYDIGAKMPVLGNPFVRFKADLLRLTKNAALEHPYRTASILIGWKLFTDVMSMASNETDRDRDTRETRVGAPHVPFTNVSLAVQTPMGEINAARLVGSYVYNPWGGASTRSDVSEFAPFEVPELRNIGTAPDIGPLASVAVDTDFRGKSISDPDRNYYTGESDLTPTEQNLNRLNYLRRQYTPTIVNSLSDIGSAAQGKTDFYGRNLEVKDAALRAYPGIKIEQYGSKEAKLARSKQADRINRKVAALEKDIKRINKQQEEGKITNSRATKRIEAKQRDIKKALWPDKGYEHSKDAPQNTLEKVGLYYESLKTDAPATASAVVSGNPIRKIRGDAVILERRKGLDKLDQDDIATDIDHIIALGIGGTNSPENVEALVVDLHKEKTKYDNSLIRRLEKGEITQDEAQRLGKINYERLLARATGSTVAEAKEATESTVTNLPDSVGELKIVYRDIKSDLDNYEKTKTRVMYLNTYKDDEGRQKALDRLEAKHTQAQTLMSKMILERPGKILDIELDANDKDSGKSTKERVAWVSEHLKTLDTDDKKSEFIGMLYDNQVLTKSVVTELNESFGLGLTKYNYGNGFRYVKGKGSKKSGRSKKPKKLTKSQISALSGFDPTDYGYKRPSIKTFDKYYADLKPSGIKLPTRTKVNMLSGL